MHIAALALFLAVQDKPVTTTAEHPETVKVTVSGRVDLDYINRSKEVTAFTRSESNPTGAGAAGASEDENTFEGHVGVRLDVAAGPASAIIEFGTKRIDGSRANIFDRWGAGPASPVVLREALLVLPDLLFEGLTAEIGISRWSFDVRGKGSPFAFDPRHSSTITRNIDSLAVTPNSAGALEQGDARLVEAAFPDELQIVGVVFIYRQGQLHIDIVLLPAVIEEGPPDQDEGLYASDFFYKLDEAGSRIGAILAVSNFGHNTDPTLADNSQLITLGVGATLRDTFLKGLELYGEVYFQFGGAGQVNFTGDDEDLDAKGRAFQAGFEYTHVVGNPLPVWFGVNFTYYSGDDDAVADNDKDVDRFASYEGINDLLILENMYTGFDIDSNYTVIKINLGTRFSAIQENDLEVTALVGIAEQTEDSQVGGQREGELGNEVDLKATWTVNKQFALKAAIGLLFGSDLLEESMRSAGAAGADQAEDNAWLWYLGFDLKF